MADINELIKKIADLYDDDVCNSEFKKLNEQYMNNLLNFDKLTNRLFRYRNNLNVCAFELQAKYGTHRVNFTLSYGKVTTAVMFQFYIFEEAGDTHSSIFAVNVRYFNIDNLLPNREKAINLFKARTREYEGVYHDAIMELRYMAARPDLSNSKYNIIERAKENLKNYHYISKIINMLVE